jgi:hypothetical protein
MRSYTMRRHAQAALRRTLSFGLFFWGRGEKPSSPPPSDGTAAAYAAYAATTVLSFLLYLLLSSLLGTFATQWYSEYLAGLGLPTGDLIHCRSRNQVGAFARVYMCAVSAQGFFGCCGVCMLWGVCDEIDYVAASAPAKLACAGTSMHTAV